MYIKTIQKHSTINTEHSKYKYTYYQNNHTLKPAPPPTHTHGQPKIIKQVETTTVQVKTNAVKRYVVKRQADSDIICDPDNQRPNKWSSAVYVNTHVCRLLVIL